MGGLLVFTQVGLSFDEIYMELGPCIFDSALDLQVQQLYWNFTLSTKKAYTIQTRSPFVMVLPAEIV